MNTKIEPHNEGSKKLNVKDGNFATLVANGRLANFVQVPKHSALKSNKKFVDGVTILEPNDNEILSQIMQSDNIYHRIVCVMKQSTQEYYNMRIILGLETI